MAFHAALIVALCGVCSGTESIAIDDHVCLLQAVDSPVPLEGQLPKWPLGSSGNAELLRSSLEEQQKQIADDARLLGKKNASIAQLKNTLNTLTGEVKVLSESRDQILQRIAEGEKAVVEMRELQQKQKHKEEAVKNILEAASKQDRIYNENIAANHELSQKLEKANAEITELQMKIKNTSMNSSKLQTFLHDSKSTFQMTYSNLTLRKEILQQNITKLEKENSELRVTVAQQSKSAHDVVEGRKKFEELVKQVTAKNHEVKEKYAKFKKDNVALSGEHARLEAAIGNAEKILHSDPATVQTSS